MTPIEIILLRGLGREKRHWYDFSSLFEKSYPEAKFIYVDLPGTGKHHQQPSPWNITDLAHALKAELQPSESQTRVLVAISLGAMVGYEFIRLNPDYFDAAVLINTSFGGWSKFWHRARPLAVPKLVSIALSSTLLQREKKTLSLVSNRHSSSQQVLDEFMDIQHSAPVTVKTLLAQTIAAACYRPPQERPLDQKTKFLILSSANDQLVHPKASQKISDQLQATLYQHPTAGHDLPLDDPTWVCQQTSSFIRQICQKTA